MMPRKETDALGAFIAAKTEIDAMLARLTAMAFGEGEYA